MIQNILETFFNLFIDIEILIRELQTY